MRERKLELDKACSPTALTADLHAEQPGARASPRSSPSSMNVSTARCETTWRLLEVELRVHQRPKRSRSA